MVILGCSQEWALWKSVKKTMFHRKVNIDISRYIINKKTQKDTLLFQLIIKNCCWIDKKTLLLHQSKEESMCEYKEIENIKLSNGKTIKQVNEEVRKEVERIYLEGWAKGISIPFWDDKGNYYLANPDGSEDLVNYDVETRSYQVLSRVAQAGQGRYAYLIK